MISREKLKLPWCNSVDSVSDDSGEIVFDEYNGKFQPYIDFILIAVNNHHELVWRLEEALRIIEMMERNEEKIIDEEPCPQCNGTGLYLTDAQARYGDEPQPCSMCKEKGDE